MSAPFRFPRFFVTTPSPCPYLAGKTERKVFTELAGPHAAELNDALGRIGFRRSQNVAYRPSCLDCSACISVRVVAGEFQPSATQRRILKRNADLEVTACKPWATEEQYELLRRYLRARHPDGGMVEMDEHDFSDMVEQSPVKTYIVEYREPAVDGVPGRLVGACLTDQQADGLSMIYSFFEPDDAAPRRASAPTSSSIISSAPAGRACPTSISAIGSRRPKRMAYKSRFRPLERLGPGGWRRFDPEQRELPLG